MTGRPLQLLDYALNIDTASVSLIPQRGDHATMEVGRYTCQLILRSIIYSQGINDRQRRMHTCIKASILLGTRRRPDPLVLSGILPAHEPLISRALAALPEAPALPPNDAAAAKVASIHGVVLLAAAPSANHAVRPLIHVVFGLFVAPVARVHAVAARETKPAERLFVVGTGAAVGQRLAGVEAESLRLAAWARRRRGEGAGRDEEELHLGDLEREFAVALAADVGGVFAPDGDEASARG